MLNNTDPYFLSEIIFVTFLYLHPVQHSRWVKPRWKKSSASVGNMPPRTSVDLKFVPAVQLLFLACSTVFLTSKGIPRWYFPGNLSWLQMTVSLSTTSSVENFQSLVESEQQFLDTWATVSLSTVSSLGNYQSSADSKQELLDREPQKISSARLPRWFFSHRPRNPR